MTQGTPRPSPSTAVAADAKRQIPIPEALKLAARHQAEGRLPQAEAIVRQVLQAQPENAFALNLLGAIAHQSGRNDLALQLFEQATRSNPAVAQFHSNLGEMCRIAGRLEDAVRHGETAVGLDPRDAGALSNLGIAHYDRREYDKAADCQRRALELAPDLAPALNNLGSILRETKDKEGAMRCYRKVLRRHPDHLESMNNLAAVLTEADQPEEAVEILLKAIRRKPDYADAHCNIGSAFLAMEDFTKARVAFERALALRAADAGAYQGLARLHQENKRLEEAQACAEKAVALAPERPESHSLLGGIYAERGFPEQAEAAYGKALELDPDLRSAHLGKGHLLMEQGDLDGAKRCFARAVELDPSGVGGRLAMVQVARVRDGDENMAALLAEAGHLGVMPETRAIPLHFALGKCYDDTGDHDRAFKHYQEGCRLKRKRIDYDAANNTRTCDNIRELFSRDTIERLRGGGSDSDLPIFVLGMPRSGTTLTEQILASHPLVHGAGELPDLMAIAGRPREQDTVGYPLSLRDLTRDDLSAMGERYVAGLRARAPDSPRITDKMPANFLALGLAHLMLPNARIVHVMRDPLDTCLSCFTRLFNKSQNQSYDLTDLGLYYRNYARLMEHWRAVLPEGAFMDLQYEELVADTETQARRLIDFCGLDWDDACLEFHKTKRDVRTASVTQVRQPIYNTSVQRWRRYEKHLAPLIDALGDCLPERHEARTCDSS